MHRTAQVVQLQIEDGIGNMEELESAGTVISSPFETPIQNTPTPKTRRHNKKRRWSKS